MAFPAFDQRGEQDTFLSLVAFDYERDNLRVGIFYHLFPCHRRICFRSLCVKKPQEIIDFRCSPDGGARVVAGCLLLDCDYGAEALDFFHVRFFEDAHELFGIDRECVHVPSLAFCKNGVECEGGFSAPAEPCDYDKAVPRYFKGNVFKVMGLCPGYFYRIVQSLSCFSMAGGTGSLAFLHLSS